MEATEKPDLEYKDPNGMVFYRMDWYPKQVPKYFQFLLWSHITYLFAFTSLGLFFNEYYFEGNVIYRFIGWLTITMYVGFIINNYKLPVSKLKATLWVFSVPIEVIVLGFILEVPFAFQIIDLFLLEMSGFMIGMLIGVVFREAPISRRHRILTFMLVLVLGTAVGLEFYPYLLDKIEGLSLWGGIAFTFPFVHASFNYFQIFTRGSFGGKHDVNMGTAPLMKLLTPFYSIFIIVWLLTPFIVKAVLN